MARKFLKDEIDIIYEQLQPDEEILWRGKPNLMPNFAFLTTLGFLFLTICIFSGIRLLKLFENHKLGNFYQDWFLSTLILIGLLTMGYVSIYAKNYYNKIKDIFYVITNNRLTIFDSKREKIIFSKLYNSVKLLRFKKTVFDSGTIVFDIDFIDERIKEIGFINIDNAESVYDIINHQLHHTRNKE